MGRKTGMSANEIFGAITVLREAVLQTGNSFSPFDLKRLDRATMKLLVSINDIRQNHPDPDSAM